MTLLLSIKNATIRQADQIVFQDLDFEWKIGEQWAILGPSGNELSLFLDTILGKTMLAIGYIERPFAQDYQKQKIAAGEVFSYRDLMASVSQKYTFRDRSNLQNFYYQQRFNSMESEATESVLTYLKHQETQKGFWDFEKVIEFLKLTHLTDKSLIKLSNGETRRLAIATALLKNPRILLLDQPTTGLDVATRNSFDHVLTKIVQSGIHVMLTTHSDEISACMTHVAVLDDKKIQQSYPNDSQQPDKKPKFSLNSFDTDLLSKLTQKQTTVMNDSVVKLTEVSIKYGNQTILDRVNWDIKRGEKWALQGENGAGKSTLLSLILAENPQAYANNIWLFGKKRGSGESIWEIKKHIGFVAPELARIFPINQTCLKVVLSGFLDTMGLFVRMSKEKEDLANAWLRVFKLEQHADTLFNHVPLEAKRFILLARALIKLPELLVLDEASQGMDAYQRALFKDTIDNLCKVMPLTLIYVSHYEEDIPDCVNKVKLLE